MDREDIQPWYRQFWPWFIIALLAFSVIAGLTTVWIALQTTDSLVVQSDDDIQAVAERRIDAERLATELGLAALVEINETTGTVSAAMRSGTLDPVPATLDFELSHPAFAERDIQITLNKAMADDDGNPVWVGHVLAIPSGRFYAVLKSGDAWRVTGEWQGESELVLRAGGTGDGR